MSDKYTLTVHIALRGTPLLKPENGTPTGKTSIPGHMWYSIQKGDGPEQSYGFQPKISLPVGPGEVVTTDNATYYKPRHERTMEITREQYEKLQEFGQNGVNQNWDFFKDTNFRRVYSAGDNSCIDFTWFALRHAGLEWQEPGKNHPTPIEASGFEGKVYPGDNWDYIQRIKAPFPDSTLNRIHEGPTPKESQTERIARNRPRHSNRTRKKRLNASLKRPAFKPPTRRWPQSIKNTPGHVKAMRWWRKCSITSQAGLSKMRLSLPHSKRLAWRKGR